MHPQVKKLNAMIVEKKSAVAPVLKELRSLRQTCQVGVGPSRHQDHQSVQVPSC